MKSGKHSKIQKFRIALISVICVIALSLGVFFVYTADYYKADVAFNAEGDISISEDDDCIVIAPDEIKAGFIFYPGGKVEYTAYIPFMSRCAEKGILCIIPEMPFNLAFFDINAADEIMENYPDIKSWFIGGHSLGGVAASSYAEKNPDKIKGLIFTGSYTTLDLTSCTFKILTVYGSDDNIVGAETYADTMENLPAGYEELVIEGGCHSYFGDYGMQEGDGVPTVSRETQQSLAAAAISSFILKNISE